MWQICFDHGVVVPVVQDQKAPAALFVVRFLCIYLVDAERDKCPFEYSQSDELGRNG